jgi:hypothetical protein
MIRISKITFREWVKVREEEGGFYDPRQGKNVLFYRDLCPEGKQLAKENFKEQRGGVLLEALKTKACRGDKRAQRKYLLASKDFESFPAIRDMNFSGEVLEQVFIVDQTVERVDFSGTFLEWTSFDGSTIKDCDFREAKLRGATFTDCSLGKNKFDKANLTAVSFQKCDLRGCSFDQAVLKQANFSGADLRGVDLSNSDCKGSFFNGAVIDETTKPPPHIKKICRFLSLAEEDLCSESTDRKKIRKHLVTLERFMGREEDYMVFFQDTIILLNLMAKKRINLKSYLASFRKYIGKITDTPKQKTRDLYRKMRGL